MAFRRAFTVCLLIFAGLAALGSPTPPLTPAGSGAIGQLIEVHLEAVLTNPAVQMFSNPYAYTEGNADYQAILDLGEDALPYLLSELEKSEGDGLREYIIALAAVSIRGEIRANQTWSTGKEWYRQYGPGADQGIPDTPQ